MFRNISKAKIIVILLLVLFLGYQYFHSFYSSVLTESAIYYEHTYGITANGIIIRNEEAVKSEQTGTLHFNVVDGEKISKDGAIAYIYENEAASAAATKIAENKEKIKLIEELEVYNDITAIDLKVLNAKINTALNEIIIENADGIFQKKEKLDSLLTLMTRKQIVMGEQTDFTVLKAALEAEIASLQPLVLNPKGSIKSKLAGYFISHADGYEEVYKPDDLSLFTPEYLRSAKPSTIENNVVGKIVYDYKWYIASVIPVSDSMFYKIGDSVTLETESITNPKIKVTVEKINVSENGDEATIVFSSNQMNADIA